MADENIASSILLQVVSSQPQGAVAMPPILTTRRRALGSATADASGPLSSLPMRWSVVVIAWFSSQSQASAAAPKVTAMTEDPSLAFDAAFQEV